MPVYELLCTSDLTKKLILVSKLNSFLVVFGMFKIKRSYVLYTPLVLVPFKTIQSAKLLGLTINDTLTWNDHIEELVKKRLRNCTFLFNLSVRMSLLQIL